MRTEWRGFKGNKWQSEVNLRDFVQNNYTSYDGDESFLAEPTQATDTLWGMLQELQKQERAKGGVLDMETGFRIDSIRCCLYRRRHQGLGEGSGSSDR